MKIGTNAVGNYGFKISKNSEETVKIKSQADNQKNPDDSKISSDEKNFFKSLYPKNAEEISNYHFYENTGKMSGVKVGSLFDRRG